VVAEPDDQPTEQSVELVFNPAPLSFPKFEIETEFHIGSSMVFAGAIV